MENIKLPAEFAEFQRVPLLWPHASPIERLERVSKAVKNDNNITIWIKRDDCNSGLAHGGNKLRAIEYLMSDVLRGECDTVVVEGGKQSNTVRQTAAAAARLGLECHIVERPGSVNWKEPDTEAYSTLGNCQITRLITSHRVKSPVEQVLIDMRRKGKRPYHILAGTAGNAIGGLGYMRLAFEIIEQEKQSGAAFDTIILASAGGTTAGAMASGFRFAAFKNPGCPNSTRKRKIISVFVGSDPWSLEGPLTLASRSALELVGCDLNKSSNSHTLIEVEMNFAFNAGGYGEVDDDTMRAMSMIARLEGILLDPVYTAKGFACMLNKVEKGDITEGSNVLFLHTGGATVLSAYAHLNFESDNFENFGKR